MWRMNGSDEDIGISVQWTVFDTRDNIHWHLTEKCMRAIMSHNELMLIGGVEEWPSVIKHTFDAMRASA